MKKENKMLKQLIRGLIAEHGAKEAMDSTPSVKHGNIYTMEEDFEAFKDETKKAEERMKHLYDLLNNAISHISTLSTLALNLTNIDRERNKNSKVKIQKQGIERGSIDQDYQDEEE